MLLIDCIQRLEDVTFVIFGPKGALVADGLVAGVTIHTQLVRVGGAHLNLVARQPTSILVFGSKLLHILQAIKSMA